MMTPQEIVHELDKHIVGQDAAKKAVAIALRNRWRRSQVAEPLRGEITPKNILMIGPTGVGKTEIARRLARLANAPVREGRGDEVHRGGLRRAATWTRSSATWPRWPSSPRASRRCRRSAPRAEDAAEERILDALLPGVPAAEGQEAGSTRQRFRKMLREGKLDDKEIEIDVAQGGGAMEIMAPPGHGGAHPADPGHVREPGRRAAPQPQARDPRGPAPRHRRGGRQARERGGDPPEGHARRRAERHRLPRRDRQDREPRRDGRAPTSRARACSATSSRSSRGPRSRPSTAWCAPTTSSSSRAAPSTSRGPPT